jgi:hypothetical protein
MQSLIFLRVNIGTDKLNKEKLDFVNFFEEAILNVGQNGCFKKCVASLHYHHET